jgi:polyisoprenyl-teichoic acid--peptidoglycan teichoic acid transferase
LEANKALNDDPRPEDPGYVYYPEETEPYEPFFRDEETIPPPSGVPGTLPHASYDPLEETRYHEIFVPKKRRRRGACSCCLMTLIVPLLLILVSAAAYFLAPVRTNILLLGLDSRPGEGMLARSDTIILTTVIPTRPYVGMLSIPRDLWVNINGVGENRINTAHFFAEGARPGSGPQGAMDAVRTNFGVDVDYYVRINFDGFQNVVNALGGVEVELDEYAGGFPPGKHHLNGDQSLALVRDRSGSDFFRMERGQLFLKAVVVQSLKPESWPRLPLALTAAMQATDTNLPVWHWPRIALAVLRTGPDGIDSRSINRDMVTSFTTSGGAQVLGPNWSSINPILFEMFGQ